MKSARFLPLLTASLVGTTLVAALSLPVAQEKPAPKHNDNSPVWSLDR